ncbi:single-stranded-DNA-specific exonuclease RecJ [Candidatus Uhrbacteria bacterium]|nr:single-stranded-DNA-specific exonuclease RecJ [Candidatus Uhrbacteria bacterium]
MDRRWSIAGPIASDFATRFPEIPRIVLQILVNRGVLRTDMRSDEAQKAIDEFLNPDYGSDIHDPFLFRDMTKAVERIRMAISNQEKITVYGDYDADGVSGAVILTTTVRALGATVDVYIPHRETEGYGVNRTAVDTIADGGTRVVITTDCGISNRDEILHANERGIDVIITDHHTLPALLPPAYAIIHPLAPHETYPFKSLAGGGVAFKFAQALLRTITPSPSRRGKGEVFDPSAFEKWLLDMVVVSTVADMMPLMGENRTLVTYGLIVLNKTKRLGLKKLIDLAGLAKNGRALDTYSVGWGIAPRINAAGRMDHANTAYALCMTENAEEAEELALALNRANTERQETVQRIVEEARARIGDPSKVPVLVAHGHDWPLGLVGLVAGKFSDEMYRPTIIMTNRQGEIAGSGRSIAGFNLIEALQKLPPSLFKKFGGHPMACGFTLASPSVIDDFTAALRAYAKKELTIESLVPTLRIDGEIKLKDIHWELWERLEHLEPFGEKNPRPRYCATAVMLIRVDRIGKDGQHIRCTLEQEGTTHPCIAFGAAELFSNFARGDVVDAVFEIDVNEWNGNRTLQLKIVDIKKSETLNSKS